MVVCLKCAVQVKITGLWRFSGKSYMHVYLYLSVTNTAARIVYVLLLRFFKLNAAISCPICLLCTCRCEHYLSAVCPWMPSRESCICSSEHTRYGPSLTRIGNVVITTLDGRALAKKTGYIYISQIQNPLNTYIYTNCDSQFALCSFQKHNTFRDFPV